MNNLLSAITRGLHSVYTTVLGVLTLVCSSASLLDLVPTPYAGIASGVCSFAYGLGLIFAADAKKVEE